MAKYKPRHIPKAQLNIGIVYCIDNAERLVKAASFVSNNYTYAAAILLSFGVEEYGKALCLKEYRKRTEEIIEVDGAVFADHELKFKKAEENLPKNALFVKVAMKKPTLLKDTAIFDSKDTVVNLATRLDHLYLDWVEEKQEFNSIPHVQMSRLQRCVDTVLEHLAKLKQEVMSI